MLQSGDSLKRCARRQTEGTKRQDGDDQTRLLVCRSLRRSCRRAGAELLDRVTFDLPPVHRRFTDRQADGPTRAVADDNTAVRRPVPSRLSRGRQSTDGRYPSALAPLFPMRRPAQLCAGDSIPINLLDSRRKTDDDGGG